MDRSGRSRVRLNSFEILLLPSIVPSTENHHQRHDLCIVLKVALELVHKVGEINPQNGKRPPGLGYMKNPRIVVNGIFGTIWVKRIGKKNIMGNLLYLIAVILIIGWVLGAFVYSAGSLIHILLVLAVIAILVRLIRGDRVG